MAPVRDKKIAGKNISQKLEYCGEESMLIKKKDTVSEAK